MAAKAVNGQGIAAKAVEIKHIMQGKPYIWGGKTTTGFDCSGFVAYVFNQHFPNMSPSFTMGAASFMSSGLFEDVSESEIQAGDIVFFPKTNSLPDHIGIVLDQSKWIGSQSSTGVSEVNFSNIWWGKRTKKFRRLVSISVSAVNAGRNFFGAEKLA